MNFNVYLNEDLSQELSALCEITHKKRNMIIREALEAYIRQFKKATWPSSILQFEGIQEFPPFESLRNDLATDTRPLFLDKY